jgi:large subunit ribosomal protein L5
MTESRLYNLYNDQIRYDLMKKFSYKSIMAVPKILKITINMGVGKSIADKRILTAATADLATISGQKPLVTHARKSIAGFKIREGMPLGCKVTLRRHRQYQFLDRLVSLAIPRIRDFRGLSTRSFDGRGNYSFGIHEQIVFPEIFYEKI